MGFEGSYAVMRMLRIPRHGKYAQARMERRVNVDRIYMCVYLTLGPKRKPVVVRLPGGLWKLTVVIIRSLAIATIGAMLAWLGPGLGSGPGFWKRSSGIT